MSKKGFLKGILLFGVGSAIGYFIADKTLEKKYKDISEEEISYVREHYNNLQKILVEKNNREKQNIDINSVVLPSKKEETPSDSYSEVVSSLNIKVDTDYIDEGLEKVTLTAVPFDEEESEEEPEEETDDGIIFEEVKPKTNAEKPYIIDQMEFGQIDGYSTITLEYYADGVLAEDSDVIEDPDSLVGLSNLEAFDHMDDYELYIRNDIRKCDYEILLEETNFYKED